MCCIIENWKLNIDIQESAGFLLVTQLWFALGLLSVSDQYRARPSPNERVGYYDLLYSFHIMRV